MRNYTTILKILFIIIFVFSISCSIILGLSASSTLANTVSSRRELYYKATNKINNSKNITIKIKQPYIEEGQVSQDTISCSLDTAITTKKYNCSMISELYGADSSLIRTSYFPGDGYKYTKIEGEEKGIKTVYTNESISAYFANMPKALELYLSQLSYDSKTVKDNNITYKSDISFDFNTFSLLKHIDIEYTINNKSQQIKYDFDKNNYLTNISYETQKLYFTIQYEKVNLKFPNLSNYLAA